MAERIYEDKSGKKIIAGTFDGIVFGRVPTKRMALPDGSQMRLLRGGGDIGAASVYISLTDVVDNTEITLQFVNESKNKVVFGTQLRIQSQNRLETIEIIAPLPPFSQFLREAGTYTLDVVWNGELLGSHRLTAHEIEERPPQKGEPS